MPRNIEFEPHEVLQKAMHVFWEKGFLETSIHDLVQATGVQRSGLYNVFGNKQNLFRQSFQLYLDTVVQKSFSVLFESPEVRIADVIFFFQQFYPVLELAESRFGCLLCHSATAYSPEMQAVHDLIEGQLQQMQEAFALALRNSKKQHDISLSVDEQEVAEYLVAAILALHSMLRGAPSRKYAKNYLDRVVAELQRL
ncbi:MAG: TetR/AcrR family transcriptional regulator [Spirochaetota bacterium]